MKVEEGCALDNKIKTVIHCLSTIDTLPEGKRVKYWVDHMPMVTNEEWEMFPEGIQDIFKEVYIEISVTDDTLAGCLVFILIAMIILGCIIFG